MVQISSSAGQEAGAATALLQRAQAGTPILEGDRATFVWHGLELLFGT